MVVPEQDIISEYLTLPKKGNTTIAPDSIPRLLAATVTHIHRLAGSTEPEVTHPKYIKESDRVYQISDRVMFAANYITAIRGLRAVQIIRNTFKDKAGSGYARRAAIGILAYGTRPDSPLNANMENEVLALDVRRERWYK